MDQDKRAQNEAIFRAANEQLKDRLAIPDPDRSIPFVCECGDMHCLCTVELTVGQYEAVRENDHRFVMLRGHDDPDSESIVASRDGYLVTEKNMSPR